MAGNPKTASSIRHWRIKTQLISRQNQLEFKHSTIKRIQAQNQAEAIENRRSQKTKKHRQSRRGKTSTSRTRPNHCRSNQKLPPVFRNSHCHVPKIASGLWQNWTTTNSSDSHPHRALWRSLPLLSNRVSGPGTCWNGTRLTKCPLNSKLGYIFALHSCDQLRTAVGNLGGSFWTQDIRRSDRQPLKYRQNQFRWPGKSNTATFAAGKINWLGWNQCQSERTKPMGMGVSEPRYLPACHPSQSRGWSN